jgi:hypothetical protein
LPAILLFTSLTDTTLLNDDDVPIWLARDGISRVFAFATPVASMKVRAEIAAIIFSFIN